MSTEGETLDSNEEESEKDLVIPGGKQPGVTDGTADKSFSEVLRQLPPEARREVGRVMASFQATSISRSPSNPLFEKFTSEHIHKYLDYIQRDDDFKHELMKTNRWFYFGYFVIGLVALGLAIVFLLPNNQDFLQDILQIIIIFGGGVGAGIGLIKSREE